MKIKRCMLGEQKDLIRCAATLTLVVLLVYNGGSSEDIKSRIAKAQGIFFTVKKSLEE